MNCQQISLEANSYLKGELEETTREEIAQHLAECSQCHLEYGEMEELLGKLADLEAPIPLTSPDAYWDKLMEKALSEPDLEPELHRNLLVYRGKSNSIFRSWGRVAAAAALLVALTLGGGKLYQKVTVEPEKASPLVKEFQWDKEYQRFLVLVDPDDPQANLKLAQWCVEKSLLAKAKKHVKVVMDLQPQNQRARKLWSEIGM